MRTQRRHRSLSSQASARAGAVAISVEVARVASLAALTLLFGCPSTAPTPVTISRIEVQGDPTSTDFTLHITGSGFGPTSLSYDLSSQKGTADSDLHLEIFDNLDRARIPVPRTALTISSPRVIDARVTSPLGPGSWGVRLFVGTGDAPIATAPDMFRIEDGVPYDGGAREDVGAGLDATDPQDGATLLPDAGSVGPDAAPFDGGVPPDAGVALDATAPPDSGLGEWVGAFQFRQAVSLANGSGAAVPANTTVRIAIPHAQLVGASRAKADGTDVAIHAGPTAVDYAWDDATKLATDELVMIAKLPIEVPAAGAPALPIVLYYGDPNTTVATTNGVFTYVQRFDAAVGGAWNTNAWNRCPYQRPTEAQTATDGTYCVADSQSTRVTLASPNVAAITRAIAASQAYEVSFWMAGRMINQNADLFYFSYGPDTTTYQATTIPAAGDFVEGAPTIASFTFQEINGSNRTVSGWRFIANDIQWWQRARVRIAPAIEGPSLHFRYLSSDGAQSAGSGVIVDDLQVRLVAQPELGATLGPVEVR